MELRLLKNKNGVEIIMQSKTMWNLAVKNIFYNKRRSMMIIFTIILSVCLVFSVITYWNSYRSVEKKEALEKEGAYHAEYKGLDTWQIKRIEKSSDISEYYITYKAEDVRIINEEFLSNYISPQIVSFDDLGEVYSLYKGRMPQGEDEIVMDRWVMEILGLSPNVGQEIHLFFNITNGDTREECQVEQSFQIVGILGDVESLRANNTSYIIFSSDFLNSISKDISCNVKVLLKSNFRCRSQIEDFAVNIGVHEENVNYNTAYLDAYGVEIADLFGVTAIIFFILFIAIIVVLNIYNIYSSQTIKIYGIFKAIGITDLQLRILNFYESLVLGTLGTIAGIVIGIAASYCVVPFMNRVNQGLTDIILNVSTLSFLTAAVAGYFVVLFASFWPLRKIMQISVAGAYNYNPVSIKSADKGKLVEKISIRYLAHTYTARYKRKLVFNILSVTSTFLLFIVASSILGSINSDRMTDLILGGDFNIQISDAVSRGEDRIDLLDADFLNKLNAFIEPENYHTIMYERVLWAEQSAENHIELPEEYLELGIGYENITSILYGYDDEFLEEVEKNIDVGKFDLEKMESGEYVIVVNDGISNISPGDELCLRSSDGGEFEVIVLGIVSNNITYRGYKASGCDMIVHQSLLERLGMDTRIQRIVISSSIGEREQLETQLRELLKEKDDITLISFMDLRMEVEENKGAISAITYGFLLILFLIVIFNLVNTTFTNILSRKKELGILEAIGLTAQQENRLLQLENLYIVGVSCVIGMIIGYPVGYIVFLMFRRQANYAVYYFPITESILLVAVLCLVQLMITNRCSNLLAKQSVVEKIKYKE